MPAASTIAIVASTVVAAGATAASAAMQPGMPDAPDYRAATREGIMADLETMPIRKQIEAAAKLGTAGEYIDPQTGQRRTYDFRGMGDVDQSEEAFRRQLETADEMTQAILDLQEEYGPAFVEARLKELELSDPEGFAIRKEMGQSLLDELESGYDLPSDLEAQIVERERASQAARGNILGQSSGAAEALATGEAAIRLRQQRLANAASFLSGVPPSAQFASIAGAQAGAAPMVTAPQQQGLTINPNAGAAGAGFAMQSYGQQSANTVAQWQNDPWQSFLGNLSGMGMGAAGYAGASRMQQAGI